MTDTPSNITPMPGITLPTPDTDPLTIDPHVAKLADTLEEMARMVRAGTITWVACTGQFDNGQKMSMFGCLHKADLVYAAGAISFLEEELKASVRATLPPL